MNLTEFLLARIAEDEAVGQSERDWMRDRYPGESDNQAHELQVDSDGWVNISAGRVLFECYAKRRIVHEHGPLNVHPDDPTFCSACEHTRFPCRTLRLLAIPYATHPDYREEWRP